MAGVFAIEVVVFEVSDADVEVGWSYTGRSDGAVLYYLHGQLLAGGVAAAAKSLAHVAEKLADVVGAADVGQHIG